MLLHLGIVAHPGKFVWTIDPSELSVHTRMAPGDLGSYKLVNMNLANYIKKKAVKFILSWVVSVLSSTMCFWVYYVIGCFFLHFV